MASMNKQEQVDEFIENVESAIAKVRGNVERYQKVIDLIWENIQSEGDTSEFLAINKDTIRQIGGNIALSNAAISGLEAAIKEYREADDEN